MKNDKIAAHTHEIYIFSKDFVRDGRRKIVQKLVSNS